VDSLSFGGSKNPLKRIVAAYKLFRYMDDASYWLNAIVRLLSDGSYWSSTNVAETLTRGAIWGKKTSSWSSPKLKRLERDGFVEANERRHYKLTRKGRLAALLGLLNRYLHFQTEKTAHGRWEWSLAAFWKQSGVSGKLTMSGYEETRNGCVSVVEREAPKMWAALLGLGLSPESFTDTPEEAARD